MSGLLNVGEMGALALHIMADLATLRKEDPDARRTAQQLAAGLAASVYTLQKVMRRLVMAKFLEGTRGVNGGVRLAVDADTISLLDVLECVEGTMETNGCLFLKRVCPEGAHCRFHSVTETMERQVRDYFTRTRIADLCADS